MYQDIHNGSMKNDFNELYNSFKKHITGDIKLYKDNTKYDLNETYTITGASIWNKASDLGKECKIISKNNIIAVVSFEDEKFSIPESIYILDYLEIFSNSY